MISCLLRCAALVGSIALLGCSPTEPKEFCGAPIAVSVANPRTTPFFRWSGGCGITDLMVLRGADVYSGDVVWSIQGLDERVPVGSPIWYGVVPPGTRAFSAPPALEPGQTYRVVVMVVVGGDGIASSGEAVFTH